MNQRPFGEHTLYHTLFTQHARPDVLDPDRVTLSCGCWPQGTPQSSGHRERIFNWKGWATHIPLCFVVLRQSIPITGDGYTKQPTTYREFIDRKLVERATVFLIHIGSKYFVGSLPLGWPHMFHRRDRTGFVYRRCSSFGQALQKYIRFHCRQTLWNDMLNTDRLPIYTSESLWQCQIMGLGDYILYSFTLLCKQTYSTTGSLIYRVK